MIPRFGMPCVLSEVTDSGSEPLEEDRDNRQNRHLTAGFKFPLAVLPETAVLFQPRKGPLYDPPHRQYLKGM